MKNWYFQLYSARKTELSKALDIVSSAGYTGIEGHQDNFSDAAAFHNAINQRGLSLPSMHIGLDMLRSDMQQSVERTKAFDCKHVVCPFLLPEDRPVDAHQWAALGEELEGIARRWDEQGCTFAWHNHDFEFISLDDGSFPIDHLLESAPSMTWETDPAWIVRAEAQAEPWIKRYLSRITAVHLKDIAPAGECEDEDGWADLCEGIVPWQSLMPLLMQSPAELYIAEHDNPNDLKRFATRSIRAANKLLA